MEVIPRAFVELDHDLVARGALLGDGSRLQHRTSGARRCEPGERRAAEREHRKTVAPAEIYLAGAVHRARRETVAGPAPGGPHVRVRDNMGVGEPSHGLVHGLPQHRPLRVLEGPELVDEKRHVGRRVDELQPPVINQRTELAWGRSRSGGGPRCTLM